MLRFLPRHQFEAFENQHSTGRRSREFSRWNQFVHLLFMQHTGRSSLRDGIQAMNSRIKNLLSLVRENQSPVFVLFQPNHGESNGTPTRWRYTEITSNTFISLGEALKADGKSWKLETEFHASRLE